MTTERDSLFDHARIAELRDVLAHTYKPEGVEIWLAHAENQGWTFDYALSLASALIDGAYV